MFKISEIRELIKLVDTTSIHRLEIENENGKIRIQKQEAASQAAVVQPAVVQPAAPAPQPAAAVQQAPAEQQPAPAASADEGLHRIVSPMVGTFYAAPAPDAAPYVKPGDHVNEKTIVCIVEAMKLMNEIEAEVSGQIVEVLVENGQLVEYGQPLFLVKR